METPNTDAGLKTNREPWFRQRGFSNRTIFLGARLERTRLLFSLCSSLKMTDRPASWRMPSSKQMEKLAAEAAHRPAPPAAAPDAPLLRKGTCHGQHSGRLVEEMRANGEAMIQQPDKLLCESCNEPMCSDGEADRSAPPTIDQAVNGASLGWRSGARAARRQVTTTSRR